MRKTTTEKTTKQSVWYLESDTMNMLKKFETCYIENRYWGFSERSKYQFCLDKLTDTDLFEDFNQLIQNQDFERLVEFFFTTFRRIFEQEFGSNEVNTAFKAQKSKFVSDIEGLSKYYEIQGNVMISRYYGTIKDVLDHDRNLKRREIENVQENILETFRVLSQKYRLGIQTIAGDWKPSFLEQCMQIGKKLDTGSLLISPEQMMETYKKGLAFLAKRRTLNFLEMYTNNKVEMTAFLKYIVNNTIQNQNYQFTERDLSNIRWYTNFRELVLEKMQFFKDMLEDECRTPIRKQGKKWILESREPKEISEKEVKILSKIVDFDVSENSKQNYGKAEFDTIMNSKLGEFQLYFWQKEAIKTSSSGQSFIIWGDTSGGKTHVLMLIMLQAAVTMNERFVYCAPTDQLALQTFANLLSTLGNSEDIALIIEQVTYIPTNPRIYIGTPKELSEYFTRYSKEETFRETVGTRKMEKIYKLAVDECHTMAAEYNPTLEGMKAANSIFNLITGLNHILNLRTERSGLRKQEKVQFIGMSASLSQESYNRLERKIMEASGIQDMHLIRYTRGNAKMYEKPTEEIVSVSNQVEYNVNFEGGVISESGNSNQEIEMNPEFYEALLFKIIEQRRTPSALFFQSEVKAIQAMQNLVGYIKLKEERSIWKQNQTRARELLNKQGLIKFISDQVVALVTMPAQEAVKCSEEYFRDLINFYERKTRTEIRNPQYSIDLYAMLYEFKNFYDGEAVFSSEVHPFFNFAGLKKNSSEHINIENIQSLLTCEGLTMSGKLIESLNDGLKYGIGIITSSIPLSFQLEISKILMKMKNSEDENFRIKFVFCDYSLSMGVDYPLTSAAIINTKLENISLGEKKQKCGRAGRNDKRGVYMESTVYFVNVRNYEELKTQEENLTFDTSVEQSYYYSPEKIEQALRGILEMQSDDLPVIMANSQINTNIFPGIENFTEDTLKLKHIKRCLRELYEISKVLISDKSGKILEMYRLVQTQIYRVMIS